MNELVILDGSEGEGGGQVLRSALSLSLVTGRPFRLENVRAKRSKPGLKPQHLACVQGAARVGHAQVTGASLGSSLVEFRPGVIVEPGGPRVHVELDVGTAGSTALLLQCLFYPVALAGGGTLVFRGGTHVTHAPTFDYVQRVWAPMLRRFGLDATFSLEAAGFFPEGGGAVRAEIAPVKALAGDLELGPGTASRVEGLSLVGGLPLHIAQRQAESLRAFFSKSRPRLPVEVEVVAPVTRHSRGSAVLAYAELSNGMVAGASALGARGKPAEQVAEEAARELASFFASGGSVDVHMGDQVLLPAALAAAGLLGAKRSTRFIAAEVTEHLRTHVTVLRAFLDVHIEVAGNTVTLSPRGEGISGSVAPASVSR